MWRWWNGSWGRLVRRDVVVWTDETGTRWAVEVRTGGADGPSRRRELPTEQGALAEAQHCRVAEGDRWVDLSPDWPDGS